jgi:hypothetical protein
LVAGQFVAGKGLHAPALGAVFPPAESLLGNIATPGHDPATRAQLIRALRVAEQMIRNVAGRLHMSGRDRLDLLHIADRIARILRRSGASTPAPRPPKPRGKK